MHYRMIMMVILAGVLTTVGLHLDTVSTQAQDESSRRIVFTSNRTGNYEIYSMNDDGSDLRQLTYTPEDEINPKWSPDKDLIAFVRDEPGTDFLSADLGLFVMNADGSNLRQLNDLQMSYWPPMWSPDGTKILVSVGEFISVELYVVDVETGETTQVTSDGGQKLYDESWSPDSSVFTYISDANLYNVDVTLAEATLVQERVGSPQRQGDLVVFGLDGDIWSTNTDGSNRTQLSQGSARAETPVLSPDGTLIAFRYSPNRAQSDNSEESIGVMNTDGSNVRILFPVGLQVRFFRWSDDSGFITFSSAGTGPRFEVLIGPRDVFVVDVTTGDLINLTEGTAAFDDANPDW